MAKEAWCNKQSVWSLLDLISSDACPGAPSSYSLPRSVDHHVGMHLNHICPNLRASDDAMSWLPVHARSRRESASDSQRTRWLQIQSDSCCTVPAANNAARVLHASHGLVCVRCVVAGFPAAWFSSLTGESCDKELGTPRRSKHDASAFPSHAAAITALSE
jgi:hypothetical protein